MLIRIISLYGLSEYLKDRAREVVEVLQAAQFAAHTPVTTQTLGPTISTQGNAQVIASQTMAQFTCGLPHPVQPTLCMDPYILLRPLFLLLFLLMEFQPLQPQQLRLT